MTRDELIKSAMQAHINDTSSKSWTADPCSRAETVTEPAWNEILRLRAALFQVSNMKSMPNARKVASAALNK